MVLLERAFKWCWSVITWPFQIVLNGLEQFTEFILTVAKTTAQRVIFLWVMIVSIFITSILMYAVFKYVYMPTAEISRPVHFSFSVCSTGHGICSFPSANISFWNKDGTSQDILGAGQFYNVYLDLDMPDTQTNRDLGMFQVLIQMYDRNGVVSIESRRTAMPKYRSQVMRIVDVLALWPLYFLDLMEQRQTLSVELFNYFTDDYYHPSVGASIEIQSHMIQFYSARLKLMAHFTGIKYMLYYWPITSAILGVFSIFGSLSLFVLGVMLRKAQSINAMTTTLHFESLQVEMSSRRRQRERERNEGQPERRRTREGMQERQPPPSGSRPQGDESADESATTKASDTDDLEDYDIPLVQEPADFPVPDDEPGLDIRTELRLRRTN